MTPIHDKGEELVESFNSFRGRIGESRIPKVAIKKLLRSPRDREFTGSQNQSYNVDAGKSIENTRIQRRRRLNN